MSLHRLTQIVMGVPHVEQTAAYYAEFGLTPVAAPDTALGTAPETASATAATTAAARPAHTLATVDGGEQLRIVHSARRRLVELGVGADDPDDLDRIAASLTALDVPVHRADGSLTAMDPGTEVVVRVEIAPRLRQTPTPAPVFNSPGADARLGERAPGILRDGPVRPRKLGHVVLGSTDQETSQRFFQEGIGFKVSDTVKGLAAFMRCSGDHHNVLVQQAPVSFLHHTSWQVDDVDEIGRGATSMLEADPGRHVWGLGRHYIGSNFFWYLKDPAGNFSEYYSDLDCVVDDALWKPGDFEGAKSLYAWGPPPPPSFLAPEDLAALMTGAHAAAK
ncbi:VOC family protein [Streptomyces mangrovisoli]|uniref:Dioxygenase n=1 Tax=Streptomyces mangrovisoli TaxID=1428628 RepID=A0A1J4NMC0_9ACTN|nr:VOC family protein [Streptomyces mangrovisoli]OIJ63451.1 dioxygenase [Streptomyces mangrovisoli]